MTTNGLIKHAGWLPTKYNPLTTIQKIEKYLQSTGREQTELPTVEGLALYLDVTSETIRQWSKEYPEFSLTIKKLADKQKTQLMNDGMYGGKEINAAMAIFLLKVNHGMRENDPTTLVQVNIKPILGGTSVQGNNGYSQAVEVNETN